MNPLFFFVIRSVKRVISKNCHLFIIGSRSRPVPLQRKRPMIMMTNKTVYLDWSYGHVTPAANGGALAANEAARSNLCPAGRPRSHGCSRTGWRHRTGILSSRSLRRMSPVKYDVTATCHESQALFFAPLLRNSNREADRGRLGESLHANICGVARERCDTSIRKWLHNYRSFPKWMPMHREFRQPIYRSGISLLTSLTACFAEKVSYFMIVSKQRPPSLKTYFTWDIRFWTLCT